MHSISGVSPDAEPSGPNKPSYGLGDDPNSSKHNLQPKSRLQLFRDNSRGHLGRKRRRDPHPHRRRRFRRPRPARKIGHDLRVGDVFLLSDPYVAGGNHLPDWVIARPIFVGDENPVLAGFAVTGPINPTSAAA